MQNYTLLKFEIMLKFTLVFFFFSIFFSCQVYLDDYEGLSIHDSHANEELYNLQSGSGNGIADFYSNEKESGELLHMIFMNNILLSDWDTLAPGDQMIISNFTDDQFALLAICYNGVNFEVMAPDYYASTPSKFIYSDSIELFLPPPSHFISCLGVALGINDIADLFKLDGLDAAAKSKKTIKILKTVGKRYLGWLGVALAVHEFYNCIDD